MADAVESLILDLLEWVARQERTYQETMDAWRTSCPRLPVWEDATDRGYLTTTSVQDRWLVQVTPAGFGVLREQRPQAYDALQHRQ